MSQYHYPRINFSGDCIIDPATANNSWFLPLVIFDAIAVSHFLPPRIYLQDQYLNKGVTIEMVKQKLPPGCKIEEDTTTRWRGIKYFKILPIDNEEDFKEWVRVPLGESKLDKAYWPLYDLFWVPTNRTSLKGCVPGYWNYYGSMSYAFRDVKVSSVATGVRHQAEQLYGEGNILAAEEVKELLGAKLTMNVHPLDDSTNECVMVDHLPTMAMHTQLFTEKLSLHKGKKVFFSGHPLKGSLRMVNAFRVVNENMPFAGSGVFYSVIPLDQLDEDESSALLKIFKKYGDVRKKLKGIFIRQVLSEIEEFRTVDYRITGNIPNPAMGKLSGSISPWYEGEMKSWPGGRQLIGDAPYIVGKPPSFDAPVSMLTPCVFNIDHVNKVAQVDLLNNFPIRNKAESDDPLEPNPYKKNYYEAYDIGQLDFILEDPNDDKQKSGILVGTIHLSEKENPRQKCYDSGGMFLLPLNLPDEDYVKLDKWNLNVYGKNNAGAQVRVWKESPIIIMTDQAGIYCSEGDDPAKGYRSYTGEKEHCYLRIFNRGRAVEKPIDLSIIEIKMNISGSQKSEVLYRNAAYKDGDIVTFGTYEPLNAIYLFLPFKTTIVPPRCYPGAVIRTGFFINLKVLPMNDFGKYLDPTHPDYPTEVTFKVMYENVFKTFSLLSPTMIFHEERFENPFMAHELLKRTSHKNWDKSWYMPVTRDLSDNQLALIEKWAEKFDKKELRLLSAADEDSSGHHHNKHLKDSNYFIR